MKCEWSTLCEANPLLYWTAINFLSLHLCIKCWMKYCLTRCVDLSNLSKNWTLLTCKTKTADGLLILQRQNDKNLHVQHIQATRVTVFFQTHTHKSSICQGSLQSKWKKKIIIKRPTACFLVQQIKTKTYQFRQILLFIYIHIHK